VRGGDDLVPHRLDNRKKLVVIGSFSAIDIIRTISSSMVETRYHRKYYYGEAKYVIYIYIYIYIE